MRILHYICDLRGLRKCDTRTHMSIARTCMNAHMVPHVHTRSHAALTRNIPTRTCATPRSTYTRHSTFENRQPSPHTHVHSKNLHARTHGRAHSHARTHEIRHVHGDTHTARTHNIRTRANVQRRGAFAYSAFDVRKRTTLTAHSRLASLF